MKYTVLVVDDEPANLDKLRRTLIRDYRVLEASSAEQALDLLAREQIDVIITDQRMPGLSGTELLEKTYQLNPNLVRIILTGYTEVQDLIAAINAGRVERYITKPWEPELLLAAVREGVERLELVRENERLNRELQTAYERLKQENLFLRRVANSERPPDRIIYASSQMKSIMGLLDRLGPTDITVLIQGETGTGKELAARYLHRKSRRRDNLFVAVNCGAIPRELIESELFGHTRGSFTGATADKKGLFEIADRGTIFLDEIGEAPPELQIKLLRVIQEGEIMPVGSSAPRKIDVRIIASTNRDLREQVEKGEFRQDLFFRLNVFSIAIPPLRERREDIRPLAEHFVERAALKLNKKGVYLSPQVMSALLSYHWPGNIRELENEIERMVILAEGPGPLDLELLSDHVRGKDVLSPQANSRPLRQALEEIERKMIDQALHFSQNNRTRAARLLGISRQALIAKIKRFGLKP